LSGFGNKLMLKRLAMSLSIREVARKSGLKQKQIKALEDEDVLRFKDKKQADEAIKAYAAALGLNQAEIVSDLNLVWSDSSTAKAYMQQKYKQEKSNIFTGNQAVKYGLLLAGLVVLIGAGGYYYWFGFDNRQHAADASVPEQGGVDLLEADLPEIEVSTGAGMEVEPASVNQEPETGDNTEEEDLLTEAAEGVEEEGIAPEIETDESDSAPVVDQEIVLPRSAGNLFLIWAGALTVITGLLLITLTLFIKDRNYYRAV